MFNRLIKLLWSNLHDEECKKFFLLSLGRFFIIGAFVPMKTLKDVIFVNLVGDAYYLWYVKGIALCSFFFLILLYSKLLNMLSREKVIYLIVSLFASTGLLFAYFLSHPTYGVAQTIPDPFRILPWLFYIFAESCNAIMVTLWWSFINDVTTPESAKRGYSMIVFFSQAGGLLTIVWSSYMFFSKEISDYARIVPLIVVGSMFMLLLVIGIVYHIKRIISPEELAGYKAIQKSVHVQKKSVKFLEGLQILFKQPYVGGIFGLIFFHEVITSVMQFQLFAIAKNIYPAPGAYNKFIFAFSLANQAIACLFAFSATSALTRIFGVRLCLVGFPIALGGCIVVYMIWPTLLSIVPIVIVGKAINYVLNVPAGEMLYIPTSKAIKYKTKVWIDIFGARFAKFSGGALYGFVGISPLLGGSISLGLIGLWVLLASSLGFIFEKITAKKEQIE